MNSGDGREERGLPKKYWWSIRSRTVECELKRLDVVERCKVGRNKVIPVYPKEIGMSRTHSGLSS